VWRIALGRHWWKGSVRRSTSECRLGSISRSSLFSLPALFLAGALLAGDALSDRVLREVRAVWITTNARLDWPKSRDRAGQQADLRAIVDRLRKANFNTIFFQVRARGDAYYRSSYEPWAENLTGTPGGDPGWDPLEYLLQEAHRAGLEVHAWFNLYKIGGSAPLPPSNPPHITRTHPGWIFSYENEFWLNPGIPAVNKYLHDVAIDLVRKYDIDGIQFDFIRYPGANVPDHREFSAYGNGSPLAEWRRRNINSFVSSFYDSATALKPWLKVGSTPVGNFNGVAGNAAPAGYSTMYQDAIGWLRSGKHDYLAPQIYWDIGSTPGDPDFVHLARLWKAASGERHIYTGIAAYKPEVLGQIPRQIDSSRSLGCEGTAIFRYGNIGDLSVLGNRYRERAVVPGMRWKEGGALAPPPYVSITSQGDGILLLEWGRPDAGTGHDATACYAIYRSASPPDLNPSVSPLHITADNVSVYRDTVQIATDRRDYYWVTALDRAHNEGLRSPVVNSPSRAPTTGEGRLPPSVHASYVPAGQPQLTVEYRIPERMDATLTLHSEGGTRSERLARQIFAGMRERGVHVISVYTTIPAGRYVLVLTAGSELASTLLLVSP
jgi:uncharacterized lipoprotein YddW (UPF0748 family)